MDDAAGERARANPQVATSVPGEGSQEATRRRGAHPPGIEDALTAPAEVPPLAAAPTDRRRVAPMMIAPVLATALVVGLAAWVLTRPAPAPLTRLGVDLGPDAVANPYLRGRVGPRLSLLRGFLSLLGARAREHAP